MQPYPFGLYGNGMHDFVMRELEVGWRVAAAEDDEACGFGPLFDLSYEEYLKREEPHGYNLFKAAQSGP